MQVCDFTVLEKLALLYIVTEEDSKKKKKEELKMETKIWVACQKVYRNKMKMI